LKHPRHRDVTLLLILGAAWVGCLATHGATGDYRDPPTLRQGFLPPRPSAIALLGPLDADSRTLGLVRTPDFAAAIEGRKAGPVLEEATRDSSQVLLAALALPVFRTGVYAGDARLIALSCLMERRVAHFGLRRANRLHAVETACGLLANHLEAAAAVRASARPAQPQPCSGVEPLYRRGYQALAGDDEETARMLIAEGLRGLAHCAEARPLLRTPVHPASRGFLVVAVLQFLGAAPECFLGGDTAPPELRSSLEAAYASGTRLVNGP
jgi:hypothetical protein